MPTDTNRTSRIDAAVNDTIVFQAVAAGGLSTLKYTWDFDASDGDDQEDASGPIVSHVYRQKANMTEPVTYKVTLTVTDAAGVKSSVKRTCEITVNP